MMRLIVRTHKTNEIIFSIIESAFVCNNDDEKIDKI